MMPTGLVPTAFSYVVQKPVAAKSMEWPLGTNKPIDGDSDQII